MNALKHGWFSEVTNLWPGMALSLRVQNVLLQQKSKYQDILIVETTHHGRALMLNGIIQCTERDEFAYQEMTSFLTLCSHPNPQKVLIIGGGDGGVAREVAKYPDVQSIIQCDIDSTVIDACQRYIPSMAKGFDEPKVTLHIGDGLEFMKNHKAEFDVIIIDIGDPIGPDGLITGQSFFEIMRLALKPNGIICTQGFVPWQNLEQSVETLSNCQKVFPVAALGLFTVPTFPTGQIGMVFGSLNPKTNFKEPVKVLKEEDLEKMSLKYYTPEVHHAAFVLPRFIEQAVKTNSVN